jgi:hypothetical protein
MHLEKGEYVENCRGMTQARMDIFAADLMKKIEPCWEFLLNIVYF